MPAAPVPVPSAAGTPPPKPRLDSLDALRGFDMFWLIGGAPFVLRLAAWIPGDDAALRHALNHAPFGGAPRAWDLVMPLFLFMSGVAAAFSEPWSNPGYRHDSRRLLRVLRRAAVLWLLGMAVQGNLLTYDPARMVFYSNTLQAIAAGGLIAEVVSLLRNERARLLATAALPVAYCAITLLAGGGYARDTNVTLRIDDAVMGLDRGDRDYAWILPSLNFGATTLLGIYAGRFLRSARRALAKTAGLAGAGLVALALAALWSLLEPVNKHLWTGSFVLWSGGWCLLLLAGFYGVVDGLGFRRWTFPLRVIGMNALAAYLLADLVNLAPVAATFTTGFRHAASPALFEVLRTGGLLLLIWLILYGLYRYRIFLKF